MITNATATAAAQAASDIRDIKPPLEIPNGWAWLWWSIGALVVCVLLTLIWRLVHKRMTKISLPPPIPAHVRAKRKLQEALALIAQPKPFCIQVSDTARAYLEERFNFHAPERTTEEFLRELRSTDLLLADQKESLGNFLASCDLVKFAKYEPGENELRELHTSALKLVEETEPDPTQPHPPAPAPFQRGAEGSTTAGRPQATSPAGSDRAKGKTLAIVGAVLQLGPCLWLLAYFAAILKILMAAKDLPGPLTAQQTAEMFGNIYGKMAAMYGGLFIVLCLALLAGIVGVILLIMALVSSRYRAGWFFWFLIIYSFFALWPFYCLGPVISIFFLAYCLTKRREFFEPK